MNNSTKTTIMMLFIIIFALAVIIVAITDIDKVLSPSVSQICLGAGWDTSYEIDGVTYCGPDKDHDGTGVIYLVSEISAAKALEIGE